MEAEDSLPHSLVTNLIQINPAHTTLSYFYTISFSIILHRTS